MGSSGDQVEPVVGKEFKDYVENRLACLEEGGMKSGAKGISRPAAGKFEKKAGSGQFSKDADAVEEPPAKKKKKREAEEEEAEEPPKKKKKKAAAEEEEEP